MHATSTQSDEKTCLQCGSRLPAGCPAGQCPVCLCRVSLLLDEETEDEVGEGMESAEPWTRLGDCDLFEELGRGGMGIVYRARHRRLGSQMAVKVLRGGELADAAARRRFQAEAETAARLHHPGIVTIHDVGEEQGVCWYSMELIAGRTLDDVVRLHPMTGRDAAECLQEVAVAVEHAHAHGVLHRDLKPSNIILDVEGRPHVTDFGIARRMGGATAATRTGGATGSPGYAAPEQVHGAATDVRTDVYGLGGILYHVLTGRPPFHGPTSEVVLMQMRDRDPLRVRSLNPLVSRDLETLCMKALAREPARRYATVAALRTDLEHYREGRPITARPVTLPERAWRWARRRPAWAALLAALVTAVTLGAAGITWQWRKAVRNLQAESAARAAEAESREGLEKNTYAADVRAASLAILDQKQWALGRSILARHAASPWRGVEWRLLWDVSRSREVAHLLPDHAMAVSAVALNEAASLLVSADGGGAVRFRDWRTREPLSTPPLALGSAVNTLTFLPDGALLIATEAAGTGEWRVAAGGTAQMTRHRPGAMVAASADGAVIATSEGQFHSWLAKPGKVRVWCPATAAEPWELPEAGQWIALSPDGKRLAVAGGADGVVLWDVASRQKDDTALIDSGRVWRPVFSSDGQRLAACSADGVWLWEWDEGDTENAAPAISGILLPHPLHVWAARFLPEAAGGTLITACADRILRGWKGDGGPRREPAFMVPGSPDEPWSLALPDGGRQMITGVKDGSIHVWAGSGAGEILEVPCARTEQMLFSEGSECVVATGDGVLPSVLRNLTTEKLPEIGYSFTPTWSPLGFSRGGGSPAVWCIGGNGPWLQQWSWDRREMTGPQYPLPLQPIAHAHLSTDGTAVYFMDREQRFSVMRLADGVSLGKFQLDLPAIIKPALSKGGKYLAVNAVGHDGPLYLVEVSTGKQRRLSGHRFAVNGVAFSPDGSRLASVASDAKLKIWDTATGAELLSLTAHLVQAVGVAWSADGLTLATISTGEGFKLWHASTGRELVSWPLPTADRTISFSPDGQWLSVGLQPASPGGPARQWLIKTPEPSSLAN
jgi:eukaryotic-like serine/threonine-protein kinase